VHLEGLTPQIGDEVALGVSHGHREAGDLDAGSKRSAVVKYLILGHHRGGQRRDDEQRQAETGRHNR
jgi:hypothetical protein